MRPTRLIGALAAALALAAVGAGPAAAAPFDRLIINGSNGLTHLGGDCEDEGKPVTEATIDWHEDLLLGTVEPEVNGEICLQAPSNGVQAQVRLEYFNLNLPGPHVPNQIIATRFAPTKTGSGPPNPNVFDISKGGLPFNSSLMHHVHVVLSDDRATPGTLSDVGSVAIGYP
jgi:hypothetical protein